MGLKERLESEKRVKNAIGFEYFKLEPMDRALFVQDLKEYIKEHL